MFENIFEPKGKPRHFLHDPFLKTLNQTPIKPVFKTHHNSTKSKARLIERIWLKASIGAQERDEQLKTDLFSEKIFFTKYRKPRGGFFPWEFIFAWF